MSDVLADLGVPVLDRSEIDVELLGKQVVQFAVADEPVRSLARLQPVRLVVAGNDAGRHRDRGEIALGRTDDRQVGAGEEIVAPVIHRRDETLRAHRHQLLAVRRVGGDAVAPVLLLADRRHPAGLCRRNVLAIVVLREPLRRERAAGHAPQHERPHRGRVAQREQHGETAARRAPADDRRQRIELRQQLVQIVRPDLVFRILAVERHVGRPAIAAVVDEDAVAGLGHRLGQIADLVHGAAAARRQRHPRAAPAQDLVVDVDAPHLRNRHRRPPDIGQSGAEAREHPAPMSRTHAGNRVLRPAHNPA